MRKGREKRRKQQKWDRKKEDGRRIGRDRKRSRRMKGSKRRGSKRKQHDNDFTIAAGNKNFCIITVSLVMNAG